MVNGGGDKPKTGSSERRNHMERLVPKRSRNGDYKGREMGKMGTVHSIMCLAPPSEEGALQTSFLVL